mmetsp:Transcript_86186/g.261607  ORF Transcript_86186/g.261607 Transcript_86186/m.261607 type:complete len:702 (+) Transcript_86186:544-2649(+)
MLPAPLHPLGGLPRDATGVQPPACLLLGHNPPPGLTVSVADARAHPNIGPAGRGPGPLHALSRLLCDAAVFQLPDGAFLQHSSAPHCPVKAADVGPDAPSGSGGIFELHLSPLRLPHVTMALLRHVCQIHTEPEHVAPVPGVRLTAVRAVGAAQGRAEALATRLGAAIGGPRVRRRLEAVREELGDGLAVRAVPELLLHGEAVLLCQEGAALLVHALERRVHHAVHGHQPRAPIVEGCRLLEGSLDLVVLGAPRQHVLEVVHGAVRGPQLQRVLEGAAPLPGAVAEDVPAAAVAAGASEPWARLPAAARVLTLRIIHGDTAPVAVAPRRERRVVFARQWRLQEHVGTNAGAVPLWDHLRNAETVEEGADVIRDGVVIGPGELRVQPAEPELRGGLRRHARVPPRLTRALSAPLAVLQRTLLLWAPLGMDLGQPSSQLPRARQELDQVHWEGLHAAPALLHDVVLHVIHPGVVCALTSEQQFAEKHEGAAPSVPDRDVRVLGEVLTGTIHLPSTPGRVKAVLCNGVDVLLWGAMPAVDHVGSAAQVTRQVVGCSAELPVQAMVPHLPGAQELAAAPGLDPARLQELHLGARDQGEDVVVARHLWHGAPTVLASRAPGLLLLGAGAHKAGHTDGPLGEGLIASAAGPAGRPGAAECLTPCTGGADCRALAPTSASSVPSPPWLIHTATAGTRRHAASCGGQRA